ncbi:MAG TPA: hypothetical protein VFW94_15115 [Candidatus Acidoferrales bacterium]|nr:hypothetical protein [Candidatus Acidoferrales bacterium]
MMGLTKKQRACLSYIEACWQETGVPPSFDEMKDHLGLRSKSGIARLIKSLEERGAIERIPNLARAIMPKRAANISILLPAELETRLRLVAATANVTPESYVASIVRDRLAIPSDNPLKATQE